MERKTLTKQTELATEPHKNKIYEAFLDDSVRPLVLVFPGGGYEHLSTEKEGRKIVNWANDLGYHAGMVSYAVEPFDRKVIGELTELLVSYQEEARVGKIFVLGFSAGAHLAGLTGIFNAEFVDGMLLSYPVVSLSSEHTHIGSRDHFFGKSVLQAEAEQYSLEKIVDKKTPPAFIWHTANDQAVPVENSLTLAMSLAKVAVPFELHVFPDGYHGLGMTGDVPHVQQWVKLAENWLKEQVNA